MLDGINTGEAPQLSSPYAKYDNGNYLYPEYDNFVGNVLNSEWSNVMSGGTLTVANGLTMTAPTLGQYIVLYLTSKVNPSIIDYLSNSMPRGALTTGYTTSQPTSGQFNCNSGYCGEAPGDYNGGGANLRGGGNNFATNFTANANDIVDSLVWVATGKEKLMFNYKNPLSATDTGTTYANSYAYTSVDSITSSATIQYIGIGRKYPPNGVMPIISFGQVQAANP